MKLKTISKNGENPKGFMNKKILLGIIFLFAVNFSNVQAQKNIDINAVNAQNQPITQSYAPVEGEEIFKDVDRYRQFDYNKQLANLREDNIGDTLLLNFFDNKKYKAVIQHVIINDIEKTVITARIVGYDFSYCYIIVSDKTIAISADLLQEDEHFFASEKNGQIYIRQMKKSVLDKDRLEGSEPLIPPTLPKPIQEGESLDSEVENFDDDDVKSMNGPNDHATIDLLFVYTQAAATWATANRGGIDNVIDLAVTEANTVMTNSNAGVTFRVAHRHLTDYTETNTSSDLYRFSDYGDGYMDEVHDLRNTFYADVMVFLANISYTGGSGWLLNNLNGFSDDTRASCICRVQQSASSYTVIHEIGHNMGAQHHRDQATHKGPNTSLPAPLNQCSSGWKGTASGVRYCTVMTYTASSEYPGESGLANYTTIPYFSSPLITHNGTIIGDATTMDNTRVIRETKTATAAYRTAPTTPTITLNHTMISFSEAPTETRTLIVSAINTTGNITYTLEGANPEVFSVNTHSTWIHSQGGILNITFSGSTTQNYEAILTVSCTGAASKVVKLKHIICSIPFIYIEESFDETVFPPDCWVRETPTNARWNRQEKGNQPNANPYSGTGMLEFTILGTGTTNGANGILISPKIATNNTDYTLSFRMYRDGYSSAYLHRVNVYINSTPSLSEATLLRTIHGCSQIAPTATSNTWNQYTVNLTTSSMPAAYVIFEGVRGTGPVNMYLDDIRIYTPIINAFPTSLDFGEVSTGTTSSSQTITVSGIALTENITQAKGGTNPAAFNITPTSLSSAGGTFNVTFSPTIAGNYSATLTLSSTGAANKEITLSGTGVSSIVPVINITNVPTETTAGTPLTLSGTVTPDTATNQTIVWSVTNAGTTGANITEGNTLNATACGTVTVTATIVNGLAEGMNYTKEFNITVNQTITPLFNGITTTYCHGANIPELPTTSDNDITGIWSPPINNTATTTYTFTPTAGQCATPTAVTITIIFIPVTNITLEHTTTAVDSLLKLTGIVEPDTACYKTVKWTVSDAGTTKAYIVDGDSDKYRGRNSSNYGNYYRWFGNRKGLCATF